MLMIEGLNMDEGSAYDVSIYSIDGKLIKRAILNHQNPEVDTRDLQNGMYLVNIHSDQRLISTQKLVVQR